MVNEQDEAYQPGYSGGNSVVTEGRLLIAVVLYALNRKELPG